MRAGARGQCGVIGDVASLSQLNVAHLRMAPDPTTSMSDLLDMSHDEHL